MTKLESASAPPITKTAKNIHTKVVLTPDLLKGKKCDFELLSTFSRRRTARLSSPKSGDG